MFAENPSAIDKFVNNHHLDFDLGLDGTTTTKLLIVLLDF